MEGKNIIVGADYERLIEQSLGELLLLLLDMHEDNVLQIDGFTGEKLTASTLLDQSICLARWLQGLNIGVGDSISVVSENRLEFGVVPTAGFLAGATFAPVNAEYTSGELRHALNLSKPKIIFCSEKTIQRVISVLDSNHQIKYVVLFGDLAVKHPKVVMFKDIMKGVNSDREFKVPDLNTQETVATILCSSGTTGMPKGVMCTHFNMTSFLDIMRSVLTSYIEEEDPDDSLMGLVPFFHSFGFMLMFLNILRGKKMIVLNKFRPDVFLESIQKYKVTRLIVPPPVVLFLLKHPLVKKYDISSLKEVRTGAAPMGKEIERQVKERFKVAHVSQGYGMTETTLGVLMSPPDKAKPGSVGKIVPGMMCKVIDESGHALGAYKEGEICFKGPLIMKGYIGDPESTANTIDKDGWLHTGDVAYYDDEGYFYIVDRLKELIKYKAFQVAPAELEALLLMHKSVLDVAVIGLPDEESGELPLAYVVRKPNHNVSAEELQEFVKEKVSSPKWLRGGVVFVEEIPRNQTGKILRRVLRERAKALKSKL